MLHHRDRTAVDSGTAFRIRDLLTLTRLNRPKQMATFYGLSVSLTNFLVQRNGSQQLTDFVERAMGKGYDQSLRECFGIDGIIELERLWRAHLDQPQRSKANIVSAVSERSDN